MVKGLLFLLAVLLVLMGLLIFAKTRPATLSETGHSLIAQIP